MADIDTAALRALLADYTTRNTYESYCALTDDVLNALPALLNAAEEAARLRAEREAKKEELVNALKALHRHGPRQDYNNSHAEADDLLAEYINDPDITLAYDEVGKWYD